MCLAWRSDKQNVKKQTNAQADEPARYLCRGIAWGILLPIRGAIWCELTTEVECVGYYPTLVVYSQMPAGMFDVRKASL